ncbi:MAG: BMP family ABC transporter substrate-binding protein [Clostridia bacterium]|nr:BMP family ABC transporter substrate-binding protein [Clostridia bacterium]
MTWLVSFLGLAILVGGIMVNAAEQLKAGWIYVGPVEDFGWTYAHDQARKVCEATFPWLETMYVEMVPEAEVETYIDLMVEKGCKVIFTTSFGYQTGVMRAAQKYPDVIFGQVAFLSQAPNIVRYFADLYQLSYLCGLMAGALTKNGKIGFVAAVPVPELKRNINATAIGLREVRPDATVHVRWLYEWYNPAAAKEAAVALIAEGCDVLFYVEDSPTVVQVAAEHGLPSFGHYWNMYNFAPESVVTSKVLHWETIYIDFLAKVYAGAYKPGQLENVFYWGLVGDGSAQLEAGPGEMINPRFVNQLKEVTVNDPILGAITVYDLVFTRLKQMQDPQLVFDPFQGPIYDSDGNLRIPAGTRADYEELFFNIEWAVPGVIGPWPGL